MKAVDVKNITKRFGSFVAVDDISFSFDEGETLGFLGPNGAGKTTTIQILLGILTPTSGDVFYFGKDLRFHRGEILERVNFSSAYTNLPWNLTVEENLSYVSYLYDIQNRRERIQEIARVFDLGDLMRKFSGDLSAGQLTRLNLAKAFLNNPKVLLLDEPTASLDPDVAKYVRTLLMEVQNRSGVSMLFTSHNMAEVEAICDRIVFIDRGKVIADDTPENLAKSIGVSRVALLISRDMDIAEQFIKKQNCTYRIDRSYLTVEIHEKSIAIFLQNLAKAGIVYDEVSIEKPSLEDYFLKVAHREYSEIL